MMEEERYEVLGNVKAQKNAVYEQWLDGAYVKVGRTARDLVPDVQAVARLRKYPGVDDFTAKGLSAFLSAKKGDRNSQVASYERERVKYWTVAPRGHVALLPHQVVVHRATFKKYKDFWDSYHREVASASSSSSSSSISPSNSVSSSSSLSSSSTMGMGVWGTGPGTGGCGSTVRTLTFSGREGGVTDMDTDLTVEEEMPQAGDRPQQYSKDYLYACREFGLITTAPLRQLPLAHLVIVRATLKELHANGVVEHVPSLRDVARIVPTNYAHITDCCRRVDDYLWSVEIGKMPVVFVVSDDGNKGAKKNTYNILAGYCPIDKYIKEINSSASRSGGKSAAIAQSLKDDGARLGVRLFAGSCTDSAAAVLCGVVAEMQRDWADFVAVGCVLHILNLVLCNAYLAAFGADAMGVLSALRLGFMVNYMMTKCPEFRESFLRFCEKNGYHEAKHICAGASTTRWWSIVASFGDIYRHLEVYRAWFEFMAAGNESQTFQPLFVEVATWLRNDKVMTDIAFILDFNDAWWVPEMDFAQGLAPWQRSLDRENQHGGYRCAEQPARAVTARRRLLRLSALVEEEDAPEFARYRQWRAKPALRAPPDDDDDDDGGSGGGDDDGGLGSLSDYEYSGIQTRRFFEVAAATLGNHHRRWLVGLLPCSIDHPNKKLGLAVAAAILARYDGKDLPDIDDDETVDLEGEEEVPLGALVRCLFQFVTADDLQTKCALTTSAATMTSLRAWVESGGSTSTEAGAKFQELLDVMIKGRPFQSHQAERAVGLGVRLSRKHGDQVTDSHFSATHSAKRNLTMSDIRSAACEYEREEREAAEEEAGKPGPGAAWVGDKPAGGPKRKRPASTQYRNKAVIGKAALNLEKRAAKVPGVFVAAYEHAGKASAAGVDVASRDEKRQREQHQKTEGAAAAREQNPAMSQYSAGEMTRRGAAVGMPRIQCGLVDLDEAANKKKPSVDDLIAECLERKLAVPMTRNDTVRRSGTDSNGAKITKAYFVALLRADNSGKRYLKLKSDEAAKAAAWEGDDDAVASDDAPHIEL